MPRKKKAKITFQMKNDDDDDQPRMMLSVKTLAGYLPNIELKHDATVADLADAVISANPDAYSNCRPVFIRAHVDGSSDELENESRLLTSFGLQCGTEEELVLLVENFSDLASRQKWKSKYTNKDLDTVMRLLQRGGRYVAVLDLGYSEFGGALCFVMVLTMASLTSITHLNLNHNDIGDAGIRILAPGLTNMKSITHLDLSNNKFGDIGFLDLVSALKELKSLAYLDLSKNKIEERGCLSLVTALDSLQGLQHLGLNHNKFGDAGVSALISALPPLVNLTTLNILGTGFNNAACKALKSVLTSMVSLKELYLDYCQVGFPELTTIMITLESFGHVEIQADGIRYQNAYDRFRITASLMNSTSLCSLVLNFVELDDDRCRVLALAFAALKSLKQLTLRNVCDLGNSEYRELANMLATLESLQKLSLMLNKMLDLAALLAVSKLTSLTHLNLSDNRIDAHGCQTLSVVLTELVSLEVLNLDSNGIDNEGCRVLAPALASMRSLTSLSLDDNPHNADSFHTIMVAAQSITSLEELMMGNRDNSMSKEACRALVPVAALVHCWWTFGRHHGFEGHGCRFCNHEFDSNDQTHLENSSSE